MILLNYFFPVVQKIDDWSLYNACISQNNETVELLIEAGADVNGPYGPLRVTFETGGNREIIKALVNNGADVFDVYPFF